ncbi:MAG: BON domain-containing protein [Pseudomonadota bacterium]|nr:BON domain-containing protein [Pseudomonadota bacterium]
MKPDSASRSLTFTGLAAAVALAVGSLTITPALADTDDTLDSMQHEVKEMSAETQRFFQNGLREGKIETALLFNENLNSFKIDVQVRNETAVLEGKVENGVERELAEEIALSVDGIDEVDNRITLSEDAREGNPERNEDGFIASIEDATITAKAKMKLLANDFVDGTDVSIDTQQKTVVLEGEVSTQAEKDLAEQLVKNLDGVGGVDNRLQVKPNHS